jgi:hypothetical protein
MTITSNSGEGLRECPFCGSKETEAINADSDICFIECRQCHATGPQAATKPDAESAWLKRLRKETPIAINQGHANALATVCKAISWEQIVQITPDISEEINIRSALADIRFMLSDMGFTDVVPRK